MQPGAPVTLPPPVTSSPLLTRPQPGPTDFGDQLTRLMAAIVPNGTTDNIEAPATGLPPSMPANTQALSVDALASGLAQPLEPPDTASTGAATSDPAALARDPASAPQPASRASNLDAAIQLPLPVAAMPMATTPETNAAIGRPRPTTASRRDGDSKGTATTTEAMPLGAIMAAAPPPATIPSEAVPPSQPDATAAALNDATEAPAQTAVAPQLPARPAASPAGAPHAEATSTMRQPTTTQDADTTPTSSAVQTPTLAASTLAQPPTVAGTATVSPGKPHPSPAAQITPALVSMSHSPDGAQRLTMKLEPPELGQVQIRIDRPADNAPAHVAITVERPETLQLLLRDQPQLQRALDLAGVPAEGRSISFHVATPEPAARTETAVAPTPAGSSSAMGGDLSHGASRQGGQPAQPETQQTTSGIADDNATVESIPIMPMRWLRAGLDITA